MPLLDTVGAVIAARSAGIGLRDVRLAAGMAAAAPTRVARAARRTLKFGGASAAGTLGLAALGGVGFQRMIANNDKPKDTPFMDAVMAIGFGDPQADRKILGTDLTAAQMFLPRPPWSNFSLISPTTFGDTRYINASLDGLEQNEAALEDVGKIVTNMSTDNPYLAARSMSGIRYVPSRRRPANLVDGSLVFGAYNLRHS